MNSPEIKKFIHEHSKLFWYTPEEKKEEISEELLLEIILNYGTLEDSLCLIELLGESNALKVLGDINGRKKGNYFPEIYNYFMLYLSRNAQRNTKQ